MGMGRVAVALALVGVSMGLAGVAKADLTAALFDAWGKNVDMARSNVSVERTPPERQTDAPGDPDVVRVVVGGSPTELPTDIRPRAGQPLSFAQWLTTSIATTRS
jgi:hypothetical protein